MKKFCLKKNWLKKKSVKKLVEEELFEEVERGSREKKIELFEGKCKSAR